MRRILVAECIHEVSSFNPAPTHYEDFAVSFGDDIVARHRVASMEVGGALDVFAAAGDVQVVPTFSARGITSGGTIPAADFDRLADEFLQAVREAMPVDGAYFALHGAMAAENELDPEGYLLTEARKILGERMPLVASFDLHGILTDRMLDQVDAAVVYHTYPHVDFRQTGERAARLLLRIMNGEVRPVTARVFIPALVRGDELITATGCFGELVRSAARLEGHDTGLSAGMFIGNPFTDVPELGSCSMVVTDNDPDAAERESLRLANEFWPHRERMQAKLTSLADAVRLARETQGTIILMDAADATSSGASGDSNVLARALVEGGYRGTILAPIVDPAAVAVANAVGLGGTVRVSVGGSVDARRFQPWPIEGQVRQLSDGRIKAESFNQEWYAGRTAVIETGPLTLVVTSRPVHLYDRSLFLALDLDPRRFGAVVVKSPHCQPHMYAEWCARLISVDAPGATSANLPTLGHTVCRRPIFPLDPEVRFEPRVQLFRRDGISGTSRTRQRQQK